MVLREAFSRQTYAPVERDPSSLRSRPWAGTASLPASARDILDTVIRIGSFNYVAEKDPIDDHDVSYVSVDADEGSPIPPEITWRCYEKGSYRLYLYRVPLTFRNEVSVTWRFDQDPAQTSNWVVTQNFAFADGDFSSFTVRALTARRLAMRVTTGEGTQQTFLFTLDQAAEAMGRLSCLRGDPAP